MIGMSWRGTHAAELSIVGTCVRQHDARCTIGSYLPRPGTCDSSQPGGRSMRFCAAAAVMDQTGSGLLHRHAGSY